MPQFHKRIGIGNPSSPVAVMKMIRCSLSAFFALILFQGAFGQSSKGAEIERYLKPFVEKQQFSGVILAFQNGKSVYRKALGAANAELNVPNSINTRFGYASITKTFTKIIALRLMEDKKLSLSDTLSKYIADFPMGDKITIEMLWRHRSGLPHRVTTPEEETNAYSPAEMVEKAKRSKLVFPPGTTRLYSSTGYSVLSRVLEIASGKNYSTLLQEYVLTPAGMNDSLEFVGERITERRAQEYLLEAERIVHAPLKDYSFLVGAGSVFGTAEDIYRFANAVLDDKLGANARLSLQDDDGVFTDNGSSNGYRCYFDVNRKKDYGFVLISNLESGANNMIIRDLAQILQNKTIQSPVIPSPKVAMEFNKSLTDYAGTFWQDTSSLEVSVSRDRLFIGRFKLYPLSIDKFYNYADYAEISFKRDALGKVVELEWNSAGRKSTWVLK